MYSARLDKLQEFLMNLKFFKIQKTSIQIAEFYYLKYSFKTML